MKCPKYIVYPVCMLAAFLIVDRGLGVLFRHLGMGSQSRYSVMYRGEADAEIVVLGNSRGVNAIYAPEATDALSRRVLNLSYNGLPMTVGEALFLDYLEHNPAPKLLVLELTNLNSQPNVLSSLKQYASCSKRLEGLLRAYDPAGFTVGRMTHLYTFNSEYFIRSLYYRSRTDQTWINRYRMSEDMAEHYVPIERDTRLLAPVADNAFESLERLLLVAARQGIEVRLLISPYWPRYLENEAAYSTWRQDLDLRLGSRHRVWDYSTRLTHRGFFGDIQHLNLEGSRVLLKQLVEDGFFDVSE